MLIYFNPMFIPWDSSVNPGVLILPTGVVPTNSEQVAQCNNSETCPVAATRLDSCNLHEADVGCSWAVAGQLLG